MIGTLDRLSPAFIASSAVIILALQAVVAATWLIPASLHIVDWTAGGPHRVGLFASRALLVELVIGGLVVAGVLIFRESRLVRPRADPADGPPVGLEAGLTHGRTAAAAAWLCLLWLWVVPYLPWLADRFPLLLVLAGPVRWLVAGVALAGAVMCGSRPKAHPANVRVTNAHVTNARVMSVPVVRRFVFVASLAVYLILGSLHARSIGPGGDEPHYLVIAHSLLTDGDLLIENNHARRDYLPFFGGNLRPDYMKRGVNGEIYSIHAPGLPVLVLPLYAVAGYAGVVALLCFIAALTALAVFDLAAALAGRRAALMAWAAVCLSVPFMPHGWLIFPELPGALLVAWAALWLAGPALTASGATPELKLGPTPASQPVMTTPVNHPVMTWVWRGAALGVLPWLHTKFIIFLAVFGAALFLRVGRRPRAAVAFAAPMAISVAAWLSSFYAIYGTFNPEAPYGAYTQVFVLVRNIPRGLLGLVFDQKFGLLIYAPIYLFAIAGCWMMLRRAQWRWLGAVLLLTTAVHVGSTTRLYMWWGGSSAPARFLVPILPCLAPMIAVAAAHIRSAAARALLWTALAASVVIAIVGLARPERLLLFSDPRGKGRLVELLQGPAPLAYLLPTFTQANWRGPLVELAPWLAASALAAASLAYVQRRREKISSLWLVSAAGLVFLFSAALLAAKVPGSGQEEAARRGAVGLMWAYDAQRLRPLDYRGLRELDQSEVFQLSRIFVRRPGGAPDPNQRMIAGPFNLPAGSYEARIRFADARPRDGEIVVAASDRAIFGRLGNLVQNPVVVPFQLPVAVGRLTVTASSTTVAADAVSLELAPTALVPPADRERAAIRAIESIPDHPGAYVAYLNEHTYPEGGVFWTRGTGAGSVLVAAGGARRITLTLFTGPAAADVTVTIAGSRQIVKTMPDQPSTLSAVIPGGQRLLPIMIQSSTFFRPAEVDPASTDHRGLGCQVRIGLE